MEKCILDRAPGTAEMVKSTNILQPVPLGIEAKKWTYCRRFGRHSQECV